MKMAVIGYVNIYNQPQNWNPTTDYCMKYRKE